MADARRLAIAIALRKDDIIDTRGVDLGPLHERLQDNGAEVARGCLEAGELDEVLVYVEPILLGDGVRLFEQPGGTEVALERIAVEVEPVATHLWFRVPQNQ